MSEYFLARYRLASYLPLEKAAAVLAGEQSSGTFLRTHLESDALRKAHAAQIASIEPTADWGAGPLPGAWNPTEAPSLNSGLVTIAFPAVNVGASLSSLLTTVAGNLFELRELAAVKLIDLEIPSAVTDRYAGPRVGVQGTRELIGGSALEGPIIGTIIKPSVGLQLEDHAALVRELAEAEIDFIKDDELNADPSYSPLAERARVTLEQIDRASQITGKRTMYAFNISDDIDQMLRNADLLESLGGTCAMVTIPTLGLAAVEHLRRHTPLAVHGHRAGFEGFGRADTLGIAYSVYQKFMRLAGADHLHVGGVDSKFFESNESVLDSINAIRIPLADQLPALPVLSSGQSAATAQSTFDTVGTDDIMVLAGGGITAHPHGVASGVRSIRESWLALRSGLTVEEAAKTNPDISAALSQFVR